MNNHDVYSLSSGALYSDSSRSSSEKHKGSSRSMSEKPHKGQNIGSMKNCHMNQPGRRSEKFERNSSGILASDDQVHIYGGGLQVVLDLNNTTTSLVIQNSQLKVTIQQPETKSRSSSDMEHQKKASHHPPPSETIAQPGPRNPKVKRGTSADQNKDASADQVHIYGGGFQVVLDLNNITTSLVIQNSKLKVTIQQLETKSRSSSDMEHKIKASHHRPPSETIAQPGPRTPKVKRGTSADQNKDASADQKGGTQQSDMKNTVTKRDRGRSASRNKISDEGKNQEETIICQSCSDKFKAEQTSTMKTKEQFLFGGQYCKGCQKTIVDADASCDSGRRIKGGEKRSSPRLEKHK